MLIDEIDIEPDEYHGVKHPATREMLDIVWEGLQEYRDKVIPECGCTENDDKWDDICGAMANMSEQLAELEQLKKT